MDFIQFLTKDGEKMKRLLPSDLLEFLHSETFWTFYKKQMSPARDFTFQ